MDNITSKDILLILIGIIGALLLAFISLQLDMLNLEDQQKSNITIIITIIIATTGVIWISYKKFREIDQELEKSNEKIEELNKRFKTIEDLNDIRLNIKDLQRKVFKNGDKK
ncbi:hypothetical protein J4466_04830 [Candidatus Pacearchaeota archaeon]|nr:hypothetical protein [Candidatus Pacearchaeota archaeon]